jgi:hypothetical protein
MFYSKKTIAVVVLLVVSSIAASVYAQEEHPRKHWRGFFRNQQPTITTSFGFTESSVNGLSQSLASPRTFELKLGGARIIEESEGILYIRHNYFTIANLTNEVSRKSSTEINADIWRFGFAWDKGYGYGSTNSPAPSVLLMYSNGVHWSKLTVKENPNVAADAELLSLYDAFRFGTKTEATVSVRVAPLVALNAGYERSAIFRRHLVWGWLGSVALEGGANWALDGFIDKIVDASPAAAPIVNFVLKNGLSYGVYQLRKEKMNYPFESEAPILNDTFKIGVTFIF